MLGRQDPCALGPRRFDGCRQFVAERRALSARSSRQIKFDTETKEIVIRRVRCAFGTNLRLIGSQCVQSLSANATSAEASLDCRLARSSAVSSSAMLSKVCVPMMSI